jgi:RHS repeat-associated protein
MLSWLWSEVLADLVARSRRLRISRRFPTGTWQLAVLGLTLVVSFALPAVVLATPPTTAIRYVYDADGQLKAVYNPANETALYSWDSTGNLLSVGLKSSAKLSIIQLSPAQGPSGETVTINGTGFSTTIANDTVKFNGLAATVSSATEWALTVKVPTGATSGTVTVQTTTEGPVTSSQTFVVVASPVPKITSLSTSIAATGSSVTITGTNFEAAHTYNDAVTINQTRAFVTSATSTSLKITVPGAALGGKVIVRTPQGTATGPDLYIPPEGGAASKVGASARITVGGAGATLKLTTTGKIGLGIVDASAGERVSFTATESTISGGGVISLWTANGTKVAQANFTTQGIIEPLTAPTTGTYTVLVTPASENSGNVKLTAYLVKDVTGAITPTVEGAKTVVTTETPGQNAKYTVEVAANAVVSLKVTGSTYGREVPFEWYNSKGELINTEYLNEPNKYLGATRFATAGTYTLVVNPPDLATGSLTLTAYNASDVTGSLTFGEPKKFTIAAPGQEAKITFAGKSGEHVSILAGEVPSTGISVQVLNPEGGVIYNSGFTRESIVEPLSLSATGTYTVAVGMPEGHTGSFKLTDYSVTDVTGAITPTTEGAKTTVTLETPGQNAKYTVEVAANEVVSLQASSSTYKSSYGNEVVFEWLNSKGELVNRETINNETSKYLGATRFTEAGTYTLVVNPVEYVTGSMILTAYNASDVTGSLTFGEPKKFTIAAPGQEAKITFAGKSGEHVSILAGEVPSTGISVQVLNPEGGVIYNSGFTRESIVEPLSLSATGTYTVAVGMPEGHTGSFKLTDYSVTDVTGAITPTTEGAKTTVTLETPGQNAKYTVEVAANEVVSLQASSSTYKSSYGNEVVFEWLNSKGELVNRETINNETSKYLGATRFTEAGTYTLVVNPVEYVTGSMILTAYNASDVTGSLTFGEPKKFTIAAPGQLAKVTFAGTGGELVTVKSSESTIASGSWAVLNPEGSNVSGNINLTGEPKYEFTPTTTGTYTIVVTPSEANTGKITLAVYKGSHALVVRPGAGALTPARPADVSHAPTNAVLTTSSENALTPVAFPATVSRPVLLASSSRTAGRSAGRNLAHTHHRHAGHQPRAATANTSRHGARRSQGRTARGGHSNVQRHDVSGLPGTRELRRTFRPARSSDWQPPQHPGGTKGWESLQPPTPWAKLAPLSATTGTTGVAGQVLALNGLPVAGVHVAIEDTYVGAQTDEAGRFLLTGQLSAGHHVLVVEGETNASHTRYGTYEIGVTVAAGKTTTLGYTIWLTPLQHEGDHRIASPTTHETRLGTPQIPGLEVRLPAGTVITDPAGKPVHNLNITAIPVDRPPFPLPPFVSVPLYFTVQPGRAYLSKGAQIIYPNWGHLPPGQRAEFWNYDANGRGWYVYGQGTVTPNGKQVIPDPGVKVWEFTGAMLSNSPTPPAKGPVTGGGKEEGDPVDLYTGLLNYHHTDLVLSDTIPIKIERSYRQSDTNSYSFGIGTASMYDMRLWSNNNYHEADLILPNGGKVHYVRTSPGEGYAEAIYESTSNPGPYYASTIKYNLSELGWDLTLSNGTTYVFGDFAPLQAIRDRYGNKLTITRTEGQKGNITQITSPHGRWVTFAYDGSNRITEIKDVGGQILKYNYNAAGTLEKITDAAGRITKYEYNASNEMTSVTDGRGNTYLKNEYDANERVSKQTLGDGGIFKFAYTLGGSGQVEATTATDPRNLENKFAFNGTGYETSETKALGTAIEQTTTYEPQTGTGLTLSTTDPRGRKTTYEYDSAGNVKKKTLLAGTGSARKLEYTYEPGTNELASETDGLKHTTTYHYGEHGELLSETDPLSHKTTYEYSPEGQRTAITNALGKTWKLSYEAGDLVGVTDPLSHRTSRFVDTLGRIISTTSPGGQRTLYEDNEDNQVTKKSDPLGASTSFEYDGDGNLTSTTDAQTHKATIAYDPMDRRESETDPLEHTGKVAYDKDGNITQFTDRRGKVTKYSYDSLNRLTEAKYGVTGETAESTIKYEYDNGNRLTKVVDSATGTYTPEYDEFDRLKSMATPAGTIKYEYDEADRRTSMTVPGQEAAIYKYDEANRLTEIKRGSQVITFTYDEANRPTKRLLVDGIEEKYGYDTANELTSIVYKKGATTLGELDYSYDPNGRHEALWGSYARVGLPEAISAAVYNADNQTTERNGKKLTYDADGNLTSDGSLEYTWNARDQLAEITGTSTASFAYDPFGRRITKTLAGTTTKVLYDGLNPVQETHGTSTANLLTGLNADVPLARTTSTATESYLTDVLGSTIALGGSTGKAETSYTYDAFGRTTNEGVASENTLQYDGRENDGNGLYYDRARYLSPANARFISPDPEGQAANGPNLYVYATNSPTNGTDPLGTTFEPTETVPRIEGERIKEIENEEAGRPAKSGPPPKNVNTEAPKGSGGWVKVACDAATVIPGKAGLGAAGACEVHKVLKGEGLGP